MKSSSRDKAEGKWHKVKGKIKQVAGKAVGNRNSEAEGKAEHTDGKVQEKIGQIKEVVEERSARKIDIASAGGIEHQVREGNTFEQRFVGVKPYTIYAVGGQSCLKEL
jgi:uncharacterized protein YjbJ (UPF0337 family)